VILNIAGKTIKFTITS